MGKRFLSVHDRGNLTLPADIRRQYDRMNVSDSSRIVQLVLTAGLGYTSFHAHGIQTDVYFVSPTVMRGRTVLEVQRTFRLAYVIPIPGSPQPTTVDWKATSVDRDTLRVEAYQVVWLSGQPSFGATWHADFKRIAEGAEGTSR